jgi:uncharacterized protein (TIGR02099 family)
MLKIEKITESGEHSTGVDANDAPREAAVARNFLRRLLFWVAIFVLVPAVIGFVAIRWWVWPELQRWQPQVEVQLSKALGAKVTVGSLEPTFSGIYPSIVATNLSTEGGAISLAKVEMEFSPRALLTRQIVFRHLNLDSGHIRIEIDEKGLWRIAGLVFDPSDRSVMDEDSKKKMSEAMRWVLQQRQLTLGNVSISLLNKSAQREDRLLINEVALTNSGRTHSFQATSSPGGVFDARWRHPTGVASDLARQWVGDLSWDSGSGPKAIKGEVLSYLLNSAHVIRNLPVLEQIAALTFEGKVRANFTKGIINSAQISEVLLSSEKLLSTAATPLVKLKRVAGQDFEVETQDLAVYGFESLSGMRLGVNGPSSINFHWGSEELGAEYATLHAAKVKLGALDVAATVGAVRHWANAQSVLDIKPLLTQAGLNRWLLAGKVQSAKLNWNEATRELSGELNADRLSLLGSDNGKTTSVQSASELPGFDRIGGTISFQRVPAGDDFVGNYEVTGDQARLLLPSVFIDSEVKFTKLNGTGKWHWFRNAEAKPDHIFQLDMDKVVFSNADMNGSVQGVYRASREPTKPGYADILGKIDYAKGVRIASYLPLKIPELTRSWVNNAIRAGDATDGTFKLKGDLWNFPFQEPGSGEFLISAKVKNAQFAFAPNWAAVENLDGEFLLDRTSIRVNGKSATVFGVAVSEVVVDLPDLKVGIVKINGKADGSVASMLNFVNTSPLKGLTVQSKNEGVKAFTESLKIDGPAKLTLAIELPIFDFTGVKVQGLVSLTNGQLSSIHTPDLRSVEGSLAFTEKTLVLQSLVGQYGDLKDGQNYPLMISGLSDSSIPLSLKISGVATAEALKKLPLLQSVVPILNSFKGAAQFDSEVEINQEAFQVQVQSSLEGMALVMPAPLGKDASQQRAFRLSYTPTELLAGLRQLGESPRIDFKVSRKGVEAKDEWFGGLNIGRADGEPMTNAIEGLSAVIKTDRLDINEWRQWLGKTFPSTKDDVAASEAQRTFVGIPGFSLSGSALKVSHVALVAKELIVEDVQFKEPVVGATLRWQPFDASPQATRLGPRLLSWQVSTQTEQANGYIQWDSNSSRDRLFARLTALNWPLSYKSGVTSENALPKLEPAPRLPSLNIVASDFSFRGTHLGALNLQTDGSQLNAYSVSEFAIKLPQVSVTGQGVWNKGDNMSRFSIAANSLDTGALLTLAGQPGVLRTGAGELKGDIRWNGNVDDFTFNGVSGDVALTLGKGQFLKTDVGAARMLGLFSVQGLVRRLNLDFRDVVSEGFAFDSIAGPIRINNGIASPDNVLIKSPIAEISFQGQVDIARRTQDLKLKVVPEVNAGAASLAYAAWVNPAIGLGSFIFQWALRKPLQGIFTTEYSVSGQWDQPLIKGLDRKLSQYGIVPTE